MWKYDGLNEIQLALLKKGIIDIGGEINGDTAKYVRDALIWLIVNGAPNITILITSGGGSVDSGRDIYDALRLYTGKKTGVVIGYVKSMAVVILQACDRKQCVRHAEIMIHNIKKEIDIDVLRSPKKLKEAKTGMEKTQSSLYKIFSVETGKSIAEIKAKCKKGKVMTAEEALTFGLIDEIIEKPLELK